MKCPDVMMCMVIVCLVSMILVILYLHRNVEDGMLFAVLPLSILFLGVFIIWRHKSQCCSEEESQQRETEYLESGNGTMGNSSDPPPVYDAVVAKPPPYQDLYIICSDTSSSSVASGTEGGPREAADRPSSRLATAEETQRDPDLPSYSEVAKTAPLVEGESEFVSRENVSSSSE